MLISSCYAQVVKALGDPRFWADIKVLCQLLEALAKVITAVQSNCSSLADVARYWIYITKALHAVLFQSTFPRGEGHVFPLPAQAHDMW